MRSKPEISIVVPVHDEVDSLEALAAQLAGAMTRVARPYEIIFVDDGSTDGSRELLAEIARRDGRVRILMLDGNHGQSAALAAGFAAAAGEITATLDADLQNDPADLPFLLSVLETGSSDGPIDVVNGVRAARRDPMVRRLASWMANGVRRAVTGDEVTDVGCSLRVMRTSCLRRLEPFAGMHRFLPILLAMQGARVVECPVRHRPRSHGSSSYGILDRLGVVVVDLLALRWMQSRALCYRVTELRAPAERRPPSAGGSPAPVDSARSA